MKSSYLKNLILLSLLAFLQSICFAQTYQGPSGGREGNPFDHWNENKAEISGVSLLEDNSVIRCIYVRYRDPATGALAGHTQSGFCDPPPGPLSFNCCRGFNLDSDEYIIGIAGRYGARVDSIRFFTNKRNL